MSAYKVKPATSMVFRACKYVSVCVELCTLCSVSVSDILSVTSCDNVSVVSYASECIVACLSMQRIVSCVELC